MRRLRRRRCRCWWEYIQQKNSLELTGIHRKYGMVQNNNKPFLISSLFFVHFCHDSTDSYCRIVTVFLSFIYHFILNSN